MSTYYFGHIAELFAARTEHLLDFLERAEAAVYERLTRSIQSRSAGCSSGE